ncbi:MAG: Hsp20/alpha crystallin family protein [Phycisphaerae bacterium]|nr:Hsp20/alpha crystallin family protein [Phycisphaerae bacterium]
MVRQTYSPLVPAAGLRRAIDRMFEDFPWALERRWPGAARAFPAMNVWEEDDAYVAESELPGVKQDDLEITAAGQELTVKGRRPPVEGEDLTYHRRERIAGDFVRTMTMPGQVKADQIEANFRNGVLTIRLPKAEEAKARRIEVKTQ